MMFLREISGEPTYFTPGIFSLLFCCELVDKKFIIFSE